MEEKATSSIVSIVVIVIAVYFIFFNNGSWLGSYYPDENDLSEYIQSPELDSLEDCRVWVSNQVPIYNPSGYGYDYECGKNCKFNKDYGVHVCKETLN